MWLKYGLIYFLIFVINRLIVNKKRYLTSVSKTGREAHKLSLIASKVNFVDSSYSPLPSKMVNKNKIIG